MYTNIGLTAISALILLLLIYNIRNSRRFNLFDHWLHHKLIRQHDGCGWRVIAFLNDPKLLVVWDIFLASFLINENKNLLALWVLTTLGFADLTGIMLKRWMHRKRPRMHSNLEAGYSFPSGHVLGITVMVLIIGQLFTSMGTGLIVILAATWLLVVTSRISLKAHYPSDILGATSLAIFCFSLCQQLFSAFI
ncbi:phosphatase PAP2 family protein [Lactobacillus xylocopicola]|nr:phosphatase PAP2 family protein [Lactobacillus xylocopicola]